METAVANRKLVSVDFNGTASEVFTYLGRVYIRVHNDFKDQHYVCCDGSDSWLVSYMQEKDLPDVNEEMKDNYIGRQTLTTVDALLKTLMGLDYCDPHEYRRAVENSTEARAWVSGLQRAKNSVEWWFANGCPLEEKDLTKVEEWSRQEGLSDEVIASKSIANTILRVRRKSTEMETSSETR
jgi:hypothetical protein